LGVNFILAQAGAPVMLNKQNSLSLEENDIRQDIINLIAEFYEWEY
jgi:hypothetical protein